MESTKTGLALTEQQKDMQLTNSSASSRRGSDTTAHSESPPDLVPSASNDEYLTGLKLWTLLFALMMTVLMIALDSSIIATAIPRITDDFHTIQNVGWYGAAYMLANSCLQPLTGKIFTYFPLKPAFFAFAAIFELGSIICAVASSSMMLVIGRAIAGLGGAGVAGGSLCMISVAAPPVQRPTIMGLVMSMFGLGMIIGPLIGGALTQHASWRWCFWINLPIGAASAAALLAVRLPPQVKPEFVWKKFFQTFDIVGFVLFTPASTMLFLALQWGGITYAWSSSTIIGLFCGSGVIYILFFFWERHQGDNAMFPPSMMSRLAIVSSALNTFFLGGALIVLGYYLALWFQVVKHASPTKSAVNILPSFLSQIIFSIVSGPISNRIGYFTPGAIFGCALSAIGTGLMTTFTPTTSAGKWIGYQVITGTGRGFAQQQPINAVQAILSKSQMATGMAIVIWAQFFGAGLLLALAQTALSALLKNALAEYAPGVDPALVINAGATDYVNVIPSQDLGPVLLAYNQAIAKTFYISVGATVIATIASFGMGWKRVVPKRSPKPKTQPDPKQSEKEQSDPIADKV